MRRQGELFERPAPRPRRRLAHAVDAGHGAGAEILGHFVCDHCGWDGGWWSVARNSDISRGIPCRRCNPEAGDAG